MSSENINSTTAPATEPTFTIEGKDYKKSELSTKTYNSIIVRQDLQATKIKLSLELEKIAILQAHYDIFSALKQINQHAIRISRHGHFDHCRIHSASTSQQTLSFAS